MVLPGSPPLKLLLRLLNGFAPNLYIDPNYTHASGSDKEAKWLKEKGRAAALIVFAM
jgi:hypothetical protein